MYVSALFACEVSKKNYNLIILKEVTKKNNKNKKLWEEAANGQTVV